MLDSGDLDPTYECSKAESALRVVPSEHRFEQIARVADTQYGLITTSDIINLGGDPGEASRLARRGYLVRQHRGVYAVGTLSLRGRLMGAVLACGPGSVVSHSSAAALWRLRSSSVPLVHITRCRGGSSRIPGVRIHQAASFDPIEQSRLHRIPVTTVAQTLFDLASQLDLEQLETVAATASRNCMVEIEELRRVAELNRGRPGSAMFHDFLRGFDENLLATRSLWERHLLRLCRDGGVRSPEAGVIINGYEVDLCWREEMVIVEFDGRVFHTDFKAFERDRERDARHEWFGYRTFRVTYRMLRSHPDRVLAHIKQLLARSTN